MPLKRKLMLIIMITSTLGLLLAGASFGIYERYRIRHGLVDDLIAISRIIGDRSTVTDDSFTALLIEPGMQIRAFVASNVALSFTGGLTLGLADAEGVALTAQPVGSAGVHYYFF